MIRTKIINKILSILKKRKSESLGDSIVIEGYVEITNGSNHIISKNSIVDQGLLSLVNLYSVDRLNNSSNLPATGWSSFSSSIRVGSDISTPTTRTTTALTNPIGAGIGTVPNSQGLSNSNISTGVWQVTYSSKWNAGVLSGIIGELGLFLQIWTIAQGLQPAGGTAAAVTPNTLFSRLSSADGKFSSFIIDSSNPVIVSWILRFTYTT